MKIYYTLKVDGKLWENVIDDMNSEESWAYGGLIIKTKNGVKDLIKNLKQYDEWKNSKFKIIWIII